MLARTRGLVAVVVLLYGARCKSLSGPSHIDDGSVIAVVSDVTGAPMPGVLVLVHDIPNSVGSFYSVGQWTGANGSTNIRGISPGRHRVEVTPPAGFGAGPTGLIQNVDVLSDKPVIVSFVLRRL